MLRLTSEHHSSPFRARGDGWGGRSALSERTGIEELSPAWLIAGLVVVGLGVLAWTYLGADLKRYMKIHKM